MRSRSLRGSVRVLFRQIGLLPDGTIPETLPVPDASSGSGDTHTYVLDYTAGALTLVDGEDAAREAPL